MKTDLISQSTNKGKHVTSHRELIIVDARKFNDNPGMREIEIADASPWIWKLPLRLSWHYLRNANLKIVHIFMSMAVR